MFDSLPKDFLYSAYQLRSTHLRGDGDVKVFSGTCFHIKDGEEIFLVTNRHNLEANYKDEKYAGYKINNLEISGYFGSEQYLDCLIEKQTLKYATSENYDEDVIALDMTKVSVVYRRRKTTTPLPTDISPINLDISLIATNDELCKIDPCDVIAFPGYPEFFDRNGNRPIMRVGTIASDPNSDYQAEHMQPGRRIAYEAHSTQGSSGSPVFAVPKGIRLGAGLEGGNYRDVMLVGINSGHLIGREEKIGQIHSGLSFCFKSSCILDAIKRLKALKVTSP